jgi:hypothetical protein
MMGWIPNRKIPLYHSASFYYLLACVFAHLSFILKESLLRSKSQEAMNTLTHPFYSYLSKQGGKMQGVLVQPMLKESLFNAYPSEDLDIIYPPWLIHDRVNEFAVIHGHLYWGPLIGSKRLWKAVVLPNDRVPVQVKADWENLMVLDTKGDVHYAKSCKGTKTLMNKLAWQKGIWDLPVISALFNEVILHDPNFSVPRDGLWATSYIESGCLYVDGAGRVHEIGDGKDQIGPTTTAFVADTKRRLFKYYDPYIPKWSEDGEKIFLPFPETSSRYLHLKGCASCRSGLFFIGFDVARAEEGGVNKTLAAYFICADANLLGLNPGIKYSYLQMPPQARDFVLPAYLYQKIQLPENGILTSLVGVVRTSGNRMTDVVLTIEGRKNNEHGFFFKKLSDAEWSFKPVPHKINPEDFLLEQFHKDEKFMPLLFDYLGMSGKGFKAELLNFGKNTLCSVINIEIEGNIHEVRLHPRQSQWDLLGFDFTEYAIVANEEVCKLLGWEKEAIPVFVENEDKIISIRGNTEVLFKFFKEPPL